MKRKILYILPILTVLILLITLLVPKKEETFNVESKAIKKENIISIMLETNEESQEYTSSSSNTWPTDGYKFNKERSGCENGSTLSWDDTQKSVIMSGDLSDKCYVYFDVLVPTIADYCTSGTSLATCIKNFGNQGSDVSSIYIHNSTLANGANDNSYRYAGASDQVNNFICFGSTISPCPENNLYRIIGVIDDKVKLIKYDYMTTDELGTDGDYYGTYSFDVTTYKGNNYANIASYYWNYNATNSGVNTWSTSLLNITNLNTNFINYLGSDWSNKISMTTWKVAGNSWNNIAKSVPSAVYQNEIESNSTSTVVNAKIGLMYVSDYYYSAYPSAWLLNGKSNDMMEDYRSVTNNNWMYMGLNEWTITPMIDQSNVAFVVSDDGSIIYFDVGIDLVERACFNLEFSVTYNSGTGTINDPILIN